MKAAPIMFFVLFSDLGAQNDSDTEIIPFGGLLRKQVQTVGSVGFSFVVLFMKDIWLVCLNQH